MTRHVSLVLEYEKIDDIDSAWNLSSAFPNIQELAKRASLYTWSLIYSNSVVFKGKGDVRTQSS